MGKYYKVSSLAVKKSKKRRNSSKPFIKFSSQEKHKAEFRNVTSVFIDFSNAGRSSEKFIEETILLCEKYNANFNMVDSGDKGRIIYILFGAPKSNEDDIRRSIDLILELRARYFKKFKAGITHGMAFTGSIGSSRRNTYTAIGDNVNSAARIMSKASEGDVMVTEEVFRNLTEFYSFSYEGTIDLKGKAKNVHTYLLDGRLKRREKSYETKFVGRDRHLKLGDSLREILLKWENGGVLDIIGEAGIGKSRLINEICKKFTDFAAIYQLSSDDINKKSLFPFIGFVREIFGVH
ncbi:MAG: adenylate/guanylate cyclase domain-containing protein [bacterium]